MHKLTSMGAILCDIVVVAVHTPASHLPLTKMTRQKWMHRYYRYGAIYIYRYGATGAALLIWSSVSVKRKWLLSRWVKKLYSWSAKNYNHSTFGWRDFGVYLCSIRYPALWNSRYFLSSFFARNSCTFLRLWIIGCESTPDTGATSLDFCAL